MITRYELTPDLTALQSQLNNAEGKKQKMILESEGFLQAAHNEGKALARQVEAVAQSLRDPNERPTERERVKALGALLELRRLEQLKAIAEGRGNSTYFFGDRCKSTSST